ncbi:MAG: transposase [Promethearchaeota archaeon]
MISEEYIPFDEYLHEVKTGEIKVSYPLEYTLKQLEKIKKKLPKSHDNIARLLALSAPMVELVFYEMGYHEPVKQPSSPGRPPFSSKALLLIHLLAQTFVADSYCQVERVFNAHPSWLKALGLKKAPNHTTLSKFRTARGEAFFDAFFHRLTQLLGELGLIFEEARGILYSVPVEFMIKGLLSRYKTSIHQRPPYSYCISSSSLRT